MTRAVPVAGLRTLRVPLFVAAAVSSASLLFWIQPVASKTLLPLLGGAALVWNAALVFFQLALLAGYGYAHLLSRRLGPTTQVWVHVGLFLIAFSFLPVEIPPEYPEGLNPVVALLVLLSVGLGMPIVMISATAPLLQKWFAHTDHPAAADPYFLYAASNIGSILALVAFPGILEPFLALGEQRRIWSVSFVGVAVLLAACGLVMLRSIRSGDGPHTSEQPAAFPIDWREKVKWMALAAVPASLLLGVTEHITTDVAAVPLLWVLPLLVYLLTYVLAFSRKRVLPDRWFYRGQSFALGVAGVWIWALTGIRALVALHVGILFVLALGCHWRLAGRRPGPSGLTQFYLWISLGGLIGGIFNAIVAPLVFRSSIEYGLAAVLACMLRPGSWGGRRRARILDVAWPLVMAAFGLGLMEVAALRPTTYPYAFLSLILIFVIVGFCFRDRPLRYGLMAAVLLLVGTRASLDRTVLERHRSYFGSYAIVHSEDDDANLLFHGTTIHGAQMLDPSGLAQPTSYYTEEGPLGQTFTALRQQQGEMSVGLVGLGIGSALCYAEEGDAWRVFEIDPLVFALASDTRYFHHWSECSPRTDVNLLIGDARVRIRASEATFDLLILDAYTSDAIPVHLITGEALDLYRDHLRPGGVILFHISNRHLALDRVLQGLAERAGMTAVIQEHIPGGGAGPLANRSVWVAVSPYPVELDTLRALGTWDILDTGSPVVWTDDYSALLGVLR